MNTEDNDHRLKKIYLQLLELSKGNLSTQIERSEKKDDIEALTALINMTTEEIKDSFLHQGYVNFHDSYRYAIQAILVLDTHFCIEDINKHTIQSLGYDNQYLFNKPFDTLLHKTSLTTWKNTQNKLAKHEINEVSIQLDFKTKNDLLLPTYCHVIHFTNNTSFIGKTIITTFDIIQTRSLIENNLQQKIQNHLLKPKKTHKTFLQLSDIDKIRAAGEHIKSHLDEQLPSLREMALTFGTNEFKLKKGFKELYGMTVFQFLKEERLKKAHIIVAHTEKSFKEIAKMVGFKSASHFSREFKIRYGYRPKALRTAKDLE